MTDELVAAAALDLRSASARWPSPTSFERLQSALDDLQAKDVVVLEAVDDHWTVSATLERLAAKGRRPVGVAYFTLPDVWHAVEHGMLEINVWHGDTANVAPGEPLLDLVLDVLGTHGIESVFDEGRIETSLAWERRPEESQPDAG